MNALNYRQNDELLESFIDPSVQNRGSQPQDSWFQDPHTVIKFICSKIILRINMRNE